ncbi:YeeE/YedE thiosulfate transporter family protein, partial [Aliarcobacter butzleri]
FLFGFGIVLAGGCECGWMYRAVEGQVHFWIVGIGNIIGATLLAFVWDDISPVLATSWPKINLLQEFANYGGLFINYGLLLIFFIVILVLEKRYLNKSRNR